MVARVYGFNTVAKILKQEIINSWAIFPDNQDALQAIKFCEVFKADVGQHRNRGGNLLLGRSENIKKKRHSFEKKKKLKSNLT